MRLKALRDNQRESDLAQNRNTKTYSNLKLAFNESLQARDERSIGSYKLSVSTSCFKASGNILVLCTLFCCCSLVNASFWTFYLPGFSKHKGFDELSRMITRIDNRIRETKDSFADASYFWEQMKLLDSLPVESVYPEESVCKEVFPMFRELAIKYAKQDYEHYIKPLESYKEYLEDFRQKWYPAGLESKFKLF